MIIQGLGDKGGSQDLSQGEILPQVKLRLRNIVYYTTADGPGVRHSIYTQGCLHNCDGCHNQHTHDVRGGKLHDIDDILDDLCSFVGVSGLTLSGGEPLLQYENLLSFLKRVKLHPRLGSLDIMLYTGYTWDEVLESFRDIFEYIDSIMVGRFVKSKYERDLLFRGSSNQVWVDIPYYLSTGNLREPK